MFQLNFKEIWSLFRQGWFRGRSGFHISRESQTETARKDALTE